MGMECVLCEVQLTLMYVEVYLELFMASSFLSYAGLHKLMRKNVGFTFGLLLSYKVVQLTRRQHKMAT
jgi:hypothetical protein